MQVLLPPIQRLAPRSGEREEAIPAAQVLAHLAERRTGLAVARTGLSVVTLGIYVSAALVVFSPGAIFTALPLLLIGCLITARGWARYGEAGRALGTLTRSDPALWRLLHEEEGRPRRVPVVTGAAAPRGGTDASDRPLASR